MDYPSKTNYSKIRPILDWYIILRNWIKGLFDKMNYKKTFLFIFICNSNFYFYLILILAMRKV